MIGRVPGCLRPPTTLCDWQIADRRLNTNGFLYSRVPPSPPTTARLLVLVRVPHSRLPPLFTSCPSSPGSSSIFYGLSRLISMGVFQELAGPLAQQLSQLGTFSQVGVVLAVALSALVFINVLQQLLFKNPNEPPLVFHWFPLIGSTITYGINPPRFFKENRAKVQSPCSDITFSRSSRPKGGFHQR